MSRPKNAETYLARLEAAPPTRPTGEQLLEQLRQMVTEQKPGALLPAESALARHFGVARMTVRQQMDKLATEGLILRVKGKGTFVTQPRLVQTEEMSSFSRDMLARGLEPGSRVLRVRVAPAGAELAAHLEIAPDELVVRISRVRTADSLPMALERTNLPASRFPGVERAQLQHASLFDTLSARYHVEPATAEQQVFAVQVRGRDAALLEVPTGSSAFRIERTTRDNMGNVIEFGRSLYRGDRYSVLMHVGLRNSR